MPLVMRHLVPVVHVADLARSLPFYERLGLVVKNTFTPPQASGPVWAWLERGAAQVMLTKADGPIDSGQQAVLFYLYFDDVAATHAELMAAGLQPGPIHYPFYAPRGEFRLFDPDGYVLMLMHT